MAPTNLTGSEGLVKGPDRRVMRGSKWVIEKGRPRKAHAGASPWAWWALLLATGLAMAACSSPAGPGQEGVYSAQNATGGSGLASTLAAQTSAAAQAPYRQLEANDEAAWTAASASGDLRQGALILKTSASFDPAGLASLGATQTGSIAVADGTWRHVSVTSGSERSVLAALRAAAGVISVTPENVLRIPAGERGQAISRSPTAPSLFSSRALGSSLLDDPYVASAEYNLAITHALEAYAAYPPGGGSTTVYAAVIDSGINLPHEDFNATLASGSGSAGATQSIVARGMSAFIRNGATSYTYVGDGNALVPMTAGTNWDDDGHGSHVAGIIGAVGDNGKGVAGVMWKGLKLISYKVLTDNESDTLGASGGDWAVYGALKDLADWWSNSGAYAGTTQHADTSQITLPVNMSLGSTYASPFEMEMIAYALRKHVLVCASMGNDGRTTAEYPAAYTGVLAVGATTGADEGAIFSTTGDWMSVSAPGFDIISTFNGSNNDYEWDSGTSMAAPFVTGLAAYLLSYAPALTPDQVKSVIEMSADKVGDTASYGAGSYGSASYSYSSLFGYGRVNVKSALDLVTGHAKNSSGAIIAIPAPGSVYSTGTLTITLSSASGTSPTADQEIYLYDASGAFVESGFTSDTQYVALPQGQAQFSLLKSGAYTAKTNCNGTVYLATATVGTTGDAFAAISLP